MKTKPFLKSKAYLMAVLIGGLFFVQSCSKSDAPPVVVINKASLQAAITASSSTLGAAVEGSAQNQYYIGSKAPFQTALDLAATILADPTSTQIMIDNTVIALNQASALFATKIIVPIDPTNLVGQWTFDAGTGNIAKDYSGNNFDGTFGVVTGMGGGANPTWTTDRYGNANKALAFDKGSKIVIPYNTKLNPVKMSISVWVKLAEQRNNKIMGLYAWNGFKFEVQDGNKAFFTGATMGPETIYDRDFAGANPLTLATWFHLTVTFGDGHNIFYVNGVKVQDWDNTPGTLRTISGHDLVFGVDCDQYSAIDTNYDVDHIIPLAWGGYFHGSMDEIRIYKSVLTDSQVKSIYDIEKAPN